MNFIYYTKNSGELSYPNPQMYATSSAISISHHSGAFAEIGAPTLVPHYHQNP